MEDYIFIAKISATLEQYARPDPEECGDDEPASSNPVHMYYIAICSEQIDNAKFALDTLIKLAKKGEAKH